MLMWDSPVTSLPPPCTGGMCPSSDGWDALQIQLSAPSLAFFSGKQEEHQPGGFSRMKWKGC